MLTDLNDNSKSIGDILDQYFDRENLTYWMAYQILTGNVDTQNRNTYLYSPQNSDTWYLIAWDNDGSFMRTEYNIQNRFDQEVGNVESAITGEMFFFKDVCSPRISVRNLTRRSRI